MIKMKKWMEQFRVEDWVVVWVSIPLLVLAAVAPSALPKVPATLLGGAAWSNIACLFAIVLVVLYAGCLMLRRPLRGLLASLVVVFAVSLLAQIVAKIPSVSYYGFESVFFSVLFGLLIRNVWHVPAWLKPAIQGEFYIKIGVVCLGATILFSDVMKSGVFGLVQACLVVAVVWFFAFRISRRMKVDERSAMILSSGVSICGVSACITAARVAGGDDRKLSYIVSLVLIVVVPMIYLMPWLAHAILPHIFDDPHVVQEVAGAWIGGTIDTTSGVAASSMIVGEVANQHAVIIKAAQNVLIGVVAFFIALYLSTRRGDKAGQAPSLGIVWEKFPKFIIGFVAASLVFSVLQGKTCRAGGRQNVLDGIFLAGLRLRGARYAPQGYRFPGEPQSAVGVPRRPGFQYRRYVPHRARAVRRAETDAGIIPGRCLSIAPGTEVPGAFHASGRAVMLVCRLPSANPAPSICRSVRPFRAFAVLSAVSCRLRLSVACSVLPVRFAAYTSVVSRPPVPCAARDFLVRNTLDAMPLWPNNIFFSLFKLSDG